MKSGGALILVINPVAPPMLFPSSSGEVIAFSIAIRARFSPFAWSYTHHHRASIVHDALYIGKVNVNLARLHNNIGDSFNAEHHGFIAHAERFAR